MTKSKTTSRAPGERLTARQRRQAAALFKSAHAGMALWRECKRKDCRRRQACADDVDQCGLRCAPKAWAWVQHAVAALAAGALRHAAMRAADKAAPRGREIIVMRWPGGVFDDVVWLRNDDGSMDRVDGPLAPAPWALQLRRLLRMRRLVGCAARCLASRNVEQHRLLRSRGAFCARVLLSSFPSTP